MRLLPGGPDTGWGARTGRQGSLSPHRCLCSQKLTWPSNPSDINVCRMKGKQEVSGPWPRLQPRPNPAQLGAYGPLSPSGACTLLLPWLRPESLATPPSGPQAWPRPQPWSCRNSIPSVAADANYFCALVGSSVTWKIQSPFNPRCGPSPGHAHIPGPAPQPLQPSILGTPTPVTTPTMASVFPPHPRASVEIL